MDYLNLKYWKALFQKDNVQGLLIHHKCPKCLKENDTILKEIKPKSYHCCEHCGHGFYVALSVVIWEAYI